ncbi:MAG: hypothetical protein ACO1N1_05940 [Dyadobacter fermentans]
MLLFALGLFVGGLAPSDSLAQSRRGNDRRVEDRRNDTRRDDARRDDSFESDEPVTNPKLNNRRLERTWTSTPKSCNSQNVSRSSSKRSTGVMPEWKEK